MGSKEMGTIVLFGMWGRCGRGEGGILPCEMWVGGGGEGALCHMWG